MWGTVKTLWKYRKPINDAENVIKEIKAMKLDLFSALKSRTVWTIIATGAIHVIPQIQALIPDEYRPIVDASLALLGIIFRIAPKQGTK